MNDKWKQERGRLEKKPAEAQKKIAALSGQEETLMRGQDVLRGLFHLPYPSFTKNVQGAYTQVNEAMARYFKESREAFVGRSDRHIYQAGYAEAQAEWEAEVLGEKVSGVRQEELMVMRNGESRWVSALRIPLFDASGQVTGLFGSFQDIHQTKQDEMQFSMLMDNLPDAIYFKDLQSHFTRINLSCARGFGLEDPESAYGKTDDDFFTETHASKALKDEQEVIRTGIPLVGKEELETQPDGRKTWISTTKLPLKDKQGRIVGTFGLSRSIHRLKQAEEKLQATNETLEKQVEERTAELRLANQEMEERIQQLDYLNQKSHELTTIIDANVLWNVIAETFAQRVPGAEQHLVEIRGDRWTSQSYTDAFAKSASRKKSIQFLKEMVPGLGGKIFCEKEWKKNPWCTKTYGEAFEPLPMYLVIPFVSDKRTLGVLEIFCPPGYASRYAKEVSLLNTLAAQVAIALDNVRHYQELGEKARLQSELEIARRIQKRFIPEDPHIPHFKLKGICLPANEVGGDYLDYFQNEAGHWVLVIADVCGKGIPAALVMTSLRSTFRTEARTQNSSKELLCAVNRIMGKDLQLDSSFITCICMVIDKEGKTLNYTRAGHPLLIRYDSSQNRPQLLPSEGIALGMLMGHTFESILEEVEMDLKPGDRFLAYTDGLNETMNKRMEIYGLNRLLELLDRDKTMEPGKVVDEILTDLEEFAGGQSQHDDLTLVALERV